MGAKKPLLRERLALAENDVTTLRERLAGAETRVKELEEQLAKHQRLPMPTDSTVLERYGWLLEKLDRREMLNKIAIKEFTAVYNRDVGRERSIAANERVRLEWIIDHEREIKDMATEAERAACLRAVTEAVNEGLDPRAALVKRGEQAKAQPSKLAVTLSQRR